MWQGWLRSLGWGTTSTMTCHYYWRWRAWKSPNPVLLDTYFTITALCPKRPFLCGAVCSCRPESTAVCSFALSFLTEFVHSPYIHPQFWQWQTWNIEFIYPVCVFASLAAFSICRLFWHFKTTYFLICNLYQVVVIKLIFYGMFEYQQKTLQYIMLCSTTKNMFSQYPRHMSKSWHASSLHFPFINGESVRRNKPTYHIDWTNQEAML